MSELNVITVNCDGILCDSEQQVAMPEGWIGDPDVGGDGHYTYCSKESCRLEKGFFADQCPGCISGYPDCGLGQSFLYADSRVGITPRELSVIETGICPFRINGTFGSSGGRIEALDLSEQAPSESGRAVATAIRNYIKKYATIS